MKTLHVIVVFTSLCSTINELKSEDNNQNIVQYCGRRLANYLQYICGSNYNTFASYNPKRNAPPYNIFRTSEAAKTLVRVRRRREGGVTNECCKKPCNINELITYCGSSTIILQLRSSNENVQNSI